MALFGVAADALVALEAAHTGTLPVMTMAQAKAVME